MLCIFFIFRHFEVRDKSNVEEAANIFSVPDFVGDACKAIASRVRGTVAGVQFDDFHKVFIAFQDYFNTIPCSPALELGSHHSFLRFWFE